MSGGTVFVVHEYGADRHFAGLEHAVRREGGTVRYLVLSPRRPAKEAWRRRSIGPLVAWLRGWGRLLELLRCSGATVVVGIAPYGAWIGYLRRLRQRHSVIYFTSWPAWAPGDPAPHRRGNPAARARWSSALRGVAAVGVSETATAALVRFGADAHAIPHAVDTSVFVPAADRSSQEGVRLLFVGRLVAEKGIEDMLAAFELVGAAHPRTTLTVVGVGPLAAAVEAAAQRDPRVSYRGRLVGDDLVRAFQHADLLLVPSRRLGPKDPGELFGIVMIEAFACGVPVLAYEGVGPREVVDDGRTGYLVWEPSATTLAERLQFVLERPERLAAMSAAAREEALRRYSLDRVGQAWLERIASAPAGPRRPAHDPPVTATSGTDRERRGERGGSRRPNT